VWRDGADRGREARLVFGWELQGMSQSADRVPIRRATEPALEVTQPAGAQTRSLGELFLRQTRRQPVLTQELPKRCGRGGRHP
jgi:hypothetical protein